ncbi:MAG TPA: hypothetical protein QGH10_10355 [Armatimonadota bacterium]|nr:hypothetical protein [Armatimonadota bacterium]
MKTKTAGMYLEAARKLAKWHAEDEPGTQVYVIPDPGGLVVNLIEVSDAFPNAAKPWPVTIGPTPDFPYTSGTLSITPTQFHQVGTGELQLHLPAGWDFSRKQKVWPE